MTDEERQQVEAALGIVNTAVDNWSPKASSEIPPGQQWRQMLSAWGIVSGIVRQTMQPQPMPAGLVSPPVPTNGSEPIAAVPEPEPADG